MDSNHAPTPTGPEHVVRHHNTLSQNIGAVFNNDLFSDLVLIVGDERFKVHKIILAAQSEYFRALFTNGMNETNKPEISIKEPNVDLFEKLLQYVYSGEVKFIGTNDAIEMMVVANKYLFTELQKSIEIHLEKILSMGNFCSIYSVAFLCSASKLLEKCLTMADTKSHEILKVDGISNLGVRAFNEIIRRESFIPYQFELFEAISSWVTVNKDEDASQLLSDVRLEEMQLEFLLKTVRPSKLFAESRILDAVTAISEKASKLVEVGKSMIEITVNICQDKTANYGNHGMYPSDTIARVKDQVRLQRMKAYALHPFSSIALYYKGIVLQDDETLESYGIRTAASMVASLALAVSGSQ